MDTNKTSSECVNRHLLDCSNVYQMLTPANMRLGQVMELWRRSLYETLKVCKTVCLISTLVSMFAQIWIFQDGGNVKLCGDMGQNDSPTERVRPAVPNLRGSLSVGHSACSSSVFMDAFFLSSICITWICRKT